MTDFNEVTKYFNAASKNLAETNSEAYKAFASFVNINNHSGVLPPKIKSMIGVALAVAARCDACIAFHVKKAIANGVNRDEMIDIINMCILMGGGPSSMYGAAALDAFDTFSKK